MTFWKASIILTIVGSAYSGVQYYRNVTKAETDVLAMRSQLAEAQLLNERQKLDWGKIEALQTRAVQAREKKVSLLKEKDDLEKKFRLLEGEFKYLVQSTRDAVEKARTAAVGQVYPELKLADGKVLKSATVRKVDDRQISFMHADGIGSVPLEMLPEELRNKFDMGTRSLASEVATLERNILSPGGLQEFEGLTLKSPLVLVEPEKKALIPPAGSPIISARNFQHASPDLEINVASVIYTEGFALSLPDAVAGSVKAMLSLDGMSEPTQSITDVDLSGTPAKRVSLSAKRFGGTLFMEIVYVIRGQHMWFVQTVFSDKSKDARPIANNILSSIAFTPAP